MKFIINQWFYSNFSQNLANCQNLRSLGCTFYFSKLKSKSLTMNVRRISKLFLLVFILWWDVYQFSQFCADFSELLAFCQKFWLLKYHFYFIESNNRSLLMHTEIIRKFRRLDFILLWEIYWKLPTLCQFLSNFGNLLTPSGRDLR